MYKKNYSVLVLLFVLYLVATYLVILLPDFGREILSIIEINMMNFWLVLLTFVIYKTGWIYWYNGVTYEQAEKVSDGARKRYAHKYFKRFFIATLIMLIVSALVILFKGPWYAVIFYDVIVIIAVAISTMNIKLEE